ncbi:hypothetical protein CK503_12375 [Aliifodinibius salipaludis]|uniref:Uncharacterized protein n=1 Tax=Fodinibius salipaludis TaxID=2032627 RepID=A0A2A2G893_9BACT|nr:hypothetical protein [Aliifodinibius salipaludis]PAU93214.1 hypothetical protein CK503_12375 [Aliifodinibius salipaludis]
MKTIQLFTFVACVLAFVGCNVSNSDEEIERTYPEAFNFETVSIQQLLTEIETPDSVNIESYIFAINQCPEDAICVAPDGIWTSESLPPTDTLFIETVDPKQFQKNKQYKISLSVDKRETKDNPDLHILGYSNSK